MSLTKAERLSQLALELASEFTSDIDSCIASAEQSSGANERLLRSWVALSMPVGPFPLNWKRSPTMA